MTIKRRTEFTLEGTDKLDQPSNWSVKISAEKDIVTLSLHWNQNEDPAHEFFINKKDWEIISTEITKTLI